MINQQIHFTVKPFEFDLFCGMDVDKRSISLTFVSHEGFVKSLKIPYDSSNLIQYVRRRYPDKRIAFIYEAGPTGFGLYDDLVKEGYVCLVVAPAQIPRAPADRIKTNRIDSRKLAEKLRGGDLKGIHVPDRIYRDLRHLVHLREVFVRNQAATKVRIKMLLLFEGIRFPSISPRERWTVTAVNQLGTLQAGTEIRFKLEQYLLALKFSIERLQAVNKQLQRFCTQNPEIWRCLGLLCSIPGIGRVVAVHLLARIGDWRLLRNSREIAALLGMVPVEDSTGDRIRKGSISRMGDAIARSKLIETAWTSIRIDPELMEYYERIKARNPAPIAGRKAIVAVGRKLTTRIYAVLKYQRPYVVKELKEVFASGADPKVNRTSGDSRKVRAGKRNP
ncbi:MAG TPA: IS110 family transposase [Acidobacteriota bacterium]|nr:IS110 family transposase [Acidobacteriota bacterium]